MTQTTIHDPAPAAVPVHVVSAEVSLPAPARPSLRYRTVYETFTLTAGDSVQRILPETEERVVAMVQSLDDDVFLAGTFSDGQKGNGAVLPKANGSPYPVVDSNSVFAANTSGTFSGTGSVSRVAVTATYLVPS